MGDRQIIILSLMSRWWRRSEGGEREREKIPIHLLQHIHMPQTERWERFGETPPTESRRRPFSSSQRSRTPKRMTRDIMQLFSWLFHLTTVAPHEDNWLYITFDISIKRLLTVLTVLPFRRLHWSTPFHPVESEYLMFTCQVIERENLDICPVTMALWWCTRTVGPLCSIRSGAVWPFRDTEIVLQILASLYSFDNTSQSARNKNQKYTQRETRKKQNNWVLYHPFNWCNLTWRLFYNSIIKH